jgi:hypothetical protein
MSCERATTEINSYTGALVKQDCGQTEGLELLGCTAQMQWDPSGIHYILYRLRHASIHCHSVNAGRHMGRSNV